MLIERKRALVFAALAALGAQVAEARKPADFADLGQLIAVARSAPTYALDPVDSETIGGWMVEILRGPDSADQDRINACEARDAGRWRSYGPEWTRALARTWHCLRRLAPAADSTALAEATSRAALRRFDPNSDYYPRLEDLTELRPDRASTGVTLRRLDNGAFRIVAVLVRSPAAEAGIGRGDELLAVDGHPVQGLPLEEVVARLQGPAGTQVDVTVLPRGATSAAERRLERRVLTPDRPSVVRMDGILVVGVNAMGRNTEAEVRNAVVSSRDGGLAAILIDLRGSQGGLLDTAVSLVDLFLDRGQILAVEERTGQPRRYFASPGDVAERLPLFVLVDRETSTGGEAVAAALSDLARARVIGERTMGRGEVRSLLPLSPARGAIVVTSGRMIRPSGQPISDAVAPAIALDADALPTGNAGEDPMLGAAIRAIRSELGQRPTASGEP